MNNNPELDQIMAWRRPGDKPLSEPMMVSLPTHLCVIWPQLVNLKTREILFVRNLFLSYLILLKFHYNDVIMSAMESQITSLTIVYLTDYSGTEERKHQSSAPLALVRGSHR